MNDSIANEEVLWLRGYSEDRYPDNINVKLNAYSYMNYASPNYNREEYFDMANKDKYEMCIRDRPTATIKLSGTAVGIGKPLTAEVAQTDNESGINISQTKWVDVYKRQ